MISPFTQTTAIIRLNLCRFLKGWTKYVVILLIIGTILPYILFKFVFVQNNLSSYNEYKINWWSTEFLLDVSAISPDSQNTVAESFRNFTKERLNVYQPVVTLMNKQEYLDKGSSYMPLIVIDKYDVDSFGYTITAVDKTGYLNFKDLWSCVSSQYCLFNPAGGIPQIAVMKFYLDQFFGKRNDVLEFYQKYEYSGRLDMRGFNFYVDIFFLALGISTLSALIEENIKGLKFGLFMTGVRRSSYYIGTLFIPFFLATIYSLLVVLMSIDLWANSASTGPLVLLTFITSYSYVFFFLTLSQVITTPRLAQLAITIFVAGGYATNYIQPNILSSMPTWAIMLTCINPRMGLSIFQYLATKSSYCNFSNQSVIYQAPSVNLIVIVCSSWMGFWMLLAIYLDWLRVSADETRPFFYFFTQCVKIHPEVELSERIVPKVEAVPGEMHELGKVVVKGLSKLYKGARTRSLDDVSLEFSKGEIFGLLGITFFDLGFNGAGKSTFINILCGVLSATTGYIKIFGMDAKKQRFEIASKTGICSQQDVLYDSLTCREHLVYFGLMRGVSNANIRKTIGTLSTELEIDDQMMRTPTAKLSGGQKRKLCVALAFIHDPELVVLDEMSSGVDPENRRVIWNFLLKRKTNRAILLCTHFMDEADIVADRKAMLTKGQLVCVGSSGYLKNVYNTGYTLTIEKKAPIEKNVLDVWFSSRKLEVEFERENEKIIEYQFMAKDLAILVDLLEKDKTMIQAINSFSIKENGLEQIFSSKELVNEKDLQISAEEKSKLLLHMKSFSTPSFLSKTGFYGKFEFKRTISSFYMIVVRLFISIVLVVILWLVFQATTQGTNTRDVVELNNDFVKRLIPESAVLETNSDDLIALAPSRYVKIGNTAGVISMGTLIHNSTYSGLKVWQGFVGANFMVLNDLFPSTNIVSRFEFVSLVNASGVTTGTSIIISLLITQLYFDLLLFIVDEISESKEKIKFLLLATGVPLFSYWLVAIFRIIVLVSPFIVLAVTSIKAGFGFSVTFISLFMVQIIFLGPLIGSAFPKDNARGFVQLLRYGNILILFVLMLLISIPQIMNNINQQAIVTFFAVFGPWSPLSIIFSSFYGKALPPDSTLIYIEAAWIVLFFLLLICVELDFKFIRKVKVSFAVGKEFVTLKAISKTFGWINPKKAVANLSLDIKRNEILALLGPNGCGKTSTLSMLTAQQLPTNGSIHIDGLHVASEKLKVISKIGLCPQFDDLLITTMTVADHLRLFCAMNGVGNEVGEEYISLLLNALGILTFKDIVCGSLSGGTKRKVSAAIAIMLPRSLVVLDEASSGLDPLARQKLWNTVSLLNQNRTTIITTHYVSETSFCDRIAIMSAGQLKCVDTEHNLAKRFAKGYKATLYFSESVPDFNSWASKALFPEGGVELTVDNVVGKVVVVDFKAFQISLGLLLQRLTAAKKAGTLMDFLIGRMTLENVFLDIINEKPKANKNPTSLKIVALSPSISSSALSGTPVDSPKPVSPETVSTLQKPAPNIRAVSMSPAARAASMPPNPRSLSMSPAARANSKNQI